MFSPVDFELVRSRRRSISLQIGDNGLLKVRAPFFMPSQIINQFVHAKSGWIAKQLSRVSSRPQRFQYCDGAKISYLGHEYQISMNDGLGLDVAVAGNKIILPELSDSQAKILIHHWLKNQAGKYLLERLEHHVAQMNVTYQKLTVSNARTRWGSCSRSGIIRLNWRLICLPVQAIDYVIVHELAHLKQHNHSRAFWDIVRSVSPQYREQRLWLKNNGHFLAM